MVRSEERRVGERVKAIVSISVVAVAIKKKVKENKMTGDVELL